MWTDDQKRASELHGEPHKAARDQVPQELMPRRSDWRSRRSARLAGTRS